MNFYQNPYGTVGSDFSRIQFSQNNTSLWENASNYVVLSESQRLAVPTGLRGDVDERPREVLLEDAQRLAEVLAMLLRQRLGVPPPAHIGAEVVGTHLDRDHLSTATTITPNPSVKNDA